MKWYVRGRRTKNRQGACHLSLNSYGEVSLVSGKQTGQFVRLELVKWRGLVVSPDAALEENKLPPEVLELSFEEWEKLKKDVDAAIERTGEVLHRGAV